MRSQVKPKVIFWRCIDVLVREKIEVPSYTRLTKLILGAINRRSQELAAIIERSLKQEVRALLDDLLTQEPTVGHTVPGKTSAYKLTLMKKLSQSTKPSKVKERVVDLSLVRGLYDQLSPTLQSLALMPGGIRYYAESVLRSEIFQLTRRDDPDRYLHVIAFIAHQFYRLQDNLVDVLLTSLRNFQNGAIREHKEQCYARREQQHEALKTLLGGLERGLFGTLTSIGSITEDQALSDTEKVTRIRALLETGETRRLLEEDPVVQLKASLVSELDEDDYYKILELKSVWIQNRVSPILKALTFQGDPGVRKLVDAIEHFKEKDGGVDRSDPTGFLDPEEQTAVNRDGKFRVSLYKALLFLHVQNGIKSGALNLEHSYKYRPLDDYLIDRDRWQRAKQQLIERAGLEGFVDPRKTLKELDEALYQQYLLTDRNIAEGKNPHIKFKKNGGFTLSTPKQEESDAEPLQQYFPDHRIVPLVEVLATVNRFTHYVDELQHPQQRYHHGKPSEAAIYAGIIGIGCAIGLRRMMRISRGITEAELEHTVNWHFTLDGLNAASDRVVHLMDRLDLPNLLRRLPEQLHTSSDGQKFEVRVDSLNANYSFKYFGKEQGVAAYTFRDERDLLWYSTVHQAQGGDGLGLVPPAQLLLEAARPLSGAKGVWTDSEIAVYPSGDRRSGAAAGHREADGSDRACASQWATFLQAEKEDQEMAEACKRLIKNCIICWNYLYLSQKLEEITDTESREALLDAVAHGSTVAWRRLNLLGEYDFSAEKLRDSVGIRSQNWGAKKEVFLDLIQTHKPQCTERIR